MIAALVAAAVAGLPAASLPQDRAPSWSPDGTAIAFIRGYRQRALYLVRPDGTSLRRLAAAPMPTPFAPAWSPNARWIAFMRSEGNGGYRVMVIGRNGKHLRSLGTGIGPAWSPSGRAVAVTRNGKLYLLPFPRGRPRLIAGAATPPLSWSPDGARLAFVFNNQVFVADLQTGATTMVAEGGLPSWSPDGRTLAIMQSCRPLLLAVGTTGPPGVSDCGFPVGVDGAVRWSFDGADISYGVCFSGFCNLYVLPASGSRPLYEFRGGQESAWAPNSAAFVYVHSEVIQIAPGSDETTYVLYITARGDGTGHPLLPG